MAGIKIQGASSNTLQGGGGSSGLRLQNPNIKLQQAGGVQQANPNSLQITQPTIQGIQLNGSGGAAPKMQNAAAVLPPSVSLGTGAAAGGDGGAAAKQAAQVASLKNDVGGLISRIKSVYDSIWGNSNTAAAQQSTQAQNNYKTTVGQINDATAANEAEIGGNYSARGTYDSSYRSNDQGTQAKAGLAQVDAAGNDLKTAQQGIGNWLSSQQANTTAQKGGLDAILNHISETTDPAELQQLRATLDAKLADTQASVPASNGQSQDLATAAKVTPAADRVAALTTTLQSIIGGSASPALKQSIGMSFIQNSGLDDNSKNQLVQQLNGALQQKVPTQ